MPNMKSRWWGENPPLATARWLLQAAEDCTTQPAHKTRPPEINVKYCLVSLLIYGKPAGGLFEINDGCTTATFLIMSINKVMSLLFTQLESVKYRNPQGKFPWIG